MRRLSWCFLLFLLAISAVTSQALAQADAQEAYQEAKSAYQAGELTPPAPIDRSSMSPRG